MSEKNESTVEVKCKYCNHKFQAKVADRKRGWARFCSKSCKAKMQHSNNRESLEKEYNEVMNECELGWDSHKGWF